MNNDTRVTITTELMTENGVIFVQSTLELYSVEQVDIGQYSCFANNTIGNDTAPFTLINVRGKSLHGYIPCILNLYARAVGQLRLLHCTDNIH